MSYIKLVQAIIGHLDEWHTTDDDGHQRCDYDRNCILNAIQGGYTSLDLIDHA